MSRGKQAPHSREYNANGLRVIQGGRCEPPVRVKRRRRVIGAVLAVLAAGLIVYILLGPVTRVIESRRNLSQVETQLKEEQSRTAALEERRAWDMTETFVEWEARKMGYVKPGEIPIIVLDYREEEATSDSTAETPVP
jgi:cell division protein FtsB